MDKMQFYEVGALMKNSYRKHKSEYECARLISYVTASCHTSKKSLKPEDIIKFEWEKSEEQQKAERMRRDAAENTTEEDIKNLANLTEKFANSFKIPEL